MERLRCCKCGERGNWRVECPKSGITMTNTTQAKMKASSACMATADAILTCALVIKMNITRTSQMSINALR